MQHQKASSDPSSKSTSTVLSTTQDVVPMSELPQMTPIRSVKATGCLKSANTCKISSKCPTSSSLKATSKKVSFALKNESVDSIRSIKPNRTTIKVTTWSLPDEEKYMIFEKLLGNAPLENDESDEERIQRLLEFAHSESKWIKHSKEGQRSLGDALLKGRFIEMYALLSQYQDLAKIHLPSRRVKTSLMKSTNSNAAFGNTGPLLLIKGLGNVWHDHQDCEGYFHKMKDEVVKLACQLLEILFKADKEAFTLRYYPVEMVTTGNQAGIGQSLFHMSESILNDKLLGRVLNNFRHQLLIYVGLSGVTNHRKLS